GRQPLPTNKMLELVAVAFQPGLGLLGIFRRRPVLHADKFFGDAHSVHFFRRLALGDWMPVLGGISSRRMMFELPFYVTQQSARTEAEHLCPKPGTAQFFFHHGKPVDGLFRGPNASRGLETN